MNTEAEPIAFQWSCSCGSSDAIYGRQADPTLQDRIDASNERFRSHPCAAVAASSDCRFSAGSCDPGDAPEETR